MISIAQTTLELYSQIIKEIKEDVPAFQEMSLFMKEEKQTTTPTCW